jgi:hypothetical protein
MITGEEFNERYKDHKFVKLTTKIENYNDLQFQTGLNINPFENSNGGIYFTDYNKFMQWLDYDINYGQFWWIREVRIPDDAQVYVGSDNFKADKIILAERQLMDWSDDDFCKLAVQQEGCALRLVTNQTEEICKLAVQRHTAAILWVKDQTDEICKLVVQQDGDDLLYIKIQTEEICKLAVQQNGNALRYVKIQTDEICKLAVQQNGNALRYVKIQTDEILKFVKK